MFMEVVSMSRVYLKTTAGDTKTLNINDLVAARIHVTGKPRTNTRDSFNRSVDVGLAESGGDEML